MTDMGDRPQFVVKVDQFPGGVRPGECHGELTDGEHYARRLSAFLGVTPVSLIVCVPCDMGLRV